MAVKFFHSEENRAQSLQHPQRHYQTLNSHAPHTGVLIIIASETHLTYRRLRIFIHNYKINV